MPYIQPEARTAIDDTIDSLAREIEAEYLAHNQILPGMLNYTITKLLLKTYQDLHGGPRYKHINDIVGILECCKLEMYRRVAAPYEREAMKKNNDLPEFIKWKAEW